MGKKAKSDIFQCEIVPAYDTCANSEVADEIDFVTNMYENVVVGGLLLTQKTIKVPVRSDACTKRSVLVIIRLSQGYPFVMPRVSLEFPAGVQPGDEGALRVDEVREIGKQLSENVQPNGLPLMMQIVSTVAQIVDRDPETVRRANDDAALTACRKGESKSAGQSPSLTPVPMRARDAMKLSILALHLLRLCCQLRNPESKEDADDNFNFLASYLIDNGIAFPPAAKNCIPWRPEVFSQAFAHAAKEAAAKSDEHRELTSWLWQNVEFSSNIRQDTAGRYAQEFIEQRLLGSGGFAPVYVCRKKVDARLYAIKKVAMRKSETSTVLQEVSTLAALNHKNIVRYYDAWIEDGCDEALLEFVGDDDSDEEEEGQEQLETSSTTSSSSEFTSARRASSLGIDASTSDSDSSSDSTSTSDEEDDVTSGSEMSDDSDAQTVHTASANTAARAHRRRNYQTLYIQMELCSARSLRHIIEAGDAAADGAGVLTEATASAILRQLLTVIAHTHHAGIVHRDLKPDNVLFETQQSEQTEDIGTIRVVDFGLARAMSGARRNASSPMLDSKDNEALGFVASGNRGSVLYCAPEQERGEDYGFKVDEFSIGMIALEMWLVLAGKNFRDRFSIMETVWRSGKLPKWFESRSPIVANTISRLVCMDVSKRATCEQILSEGNLLGEPPELTEALQTVYRYSDHVFPQILQRIVRQNGATTQRASVNMREAAAALSTGSQSNLAQAVTLVATLHGHVAVPCFDQLLPLTPQLQKLNVPTVLDTGSRCFCLAEAPQFAVAAFLGLQENADIGAFYQFYYRTRPLAVFSVPLPKVCMVNELLMEPLLSLFHLLSIVDLSQTHVKLVISHADWLNTTYPTAVGSRPPPDNLIGLGSELHGAESVGPALYHIIEALQSGGLPALTERDEFIRRFATLALEARGYFGKHMEACVSVHLDPLMQPSDHLVCRAALEHGILIQCYHSKDVPFALGCHLDDFAACCMISRKHGDVNAFSVCVDLRELGTVGKHVKIADTEPLVLDGVGVRRKDLYSQAYLSSTMRAAVTLWKGNVRACLRVDTDVHSFTKALKIKQLRWLLIDGTHLRSVTSNLHGKASGEKSGIPTDQLLLSVRHTVGPERVEAPPVFFPGGRTETTAEEEAKQAFCGMLASAVIAIVPLKTAEIEWCLREGSVLPDEGDAAQKGGDRKASHTPDVNAVAELQKWLKEQEKKHALFAVYSTKEESFCFKVSDAYAKKHGPSKRHHNGTSGAGSSKKK